jgi:hypothetical protein
MRRIGVLLVAIGLLSGRLAFGATELIVNGGFESLTPPWQFLGNLNGLSVSSNPTLAHGGNNFLNMGNVNGTQGQRVFQVVTIPTNTIAASFSYFWSGVTTDPVSTSELSALIVSTNGLNRSNVLRSDLNANTGYKFRTSDLTAYAGQTIGIAFQVDFANTTNGAGTAYRVDDVSLLSFTAADIPVNDSFANASLLTTNVTLTATNIVASGEPGEPKHAGKTGGHSLWWKWTAPSNGVVTLNTLNSTFNTLLGVYTGSSVSNLNQVASNDDANPSQNIFTSKLKVSVTAGTEYKIAVDGKNGETGVVQLSLAFSVDSIDPKVAISSPKSGTQLTDSTVLVQGTASDDLAVATVQFRLENAAGTNDYQNADGTTTWSATVNGLIPGPNTIRVRAFDTSSNESASVTSTVTFVVVSPLTVTITGTGTVTPNLNGTSQNVGATLTMTAKPGTGQVFSNWTVANVPFATTTALTFVMQSNMVLQANFVPNPFIPVAGTYQGLFYDTNGPAHKSSGFLSATLSSAGAFSAKIVLAGQKASLSGQFSADGSFSNNIIRKGLSPVSAQLTLDLAGGGITGLLSDSTWTAELIASKTLTAPGATAGKYTLLIPGGADGVAEPGGDSYGTIVVGSTGGIALKGALADGSKVAQKANLLVTGQWPFYVPLYSGGGSIFGWLTFNNGVISGTVDWFKPSQPGGKLYPAGFSHGTPAAVGSVYQFTSGVPVLNFSTGQIWLANGNLTGSFTNEITLDSASKVTSTNATMKVAISTSTGSFKGTVADPATGKSIPFAGVVLQQQNSGGGFFLGTNQTGRVFLGP